MAKRGFTDGYKTYDTTNGFGDVSQWQKSFRDAMSQEEAVEVLKEETPYSILGVSRTATQAEIKKAFRTLIAEWHPDMNPHRLEEAEAQSKKIIASYTLLKTK